MTSMLIHRCRYASGLLERTIGISKQMLDPNSRGLDTLSTSVPVPEDVQVPLNSLEDSLLLLILPPPIALGLELLLEPLLESELPGSDQASSA
eukprot:snap_masked-scaffold_15-processed-gene-9.9-mRNA-1 protein AED:1.00 eAED:1.00 QI:0/0/0/0/1/1/2/0/92